MKSQTFPRIVLKSQTLHIFLRSNLLKSTPTQVKLVLVFLQQIPKRRGFPKKIVEDLHWVPDKLPSSVFRLLEHAVFEAGIAISRGGDGLGLLMNQGDIHVFVRIVFFKPNSSQYKIKNLNLRKSNHIFQVFIMKSPSLIKLRPFYRIDQEYS
jgi:hypothetical protein